MYQPQFRPGFLLEPLPEPRVLARRLMLATSMLVDGFLDGNPERFHPYLQHSLLMPQADLLIVGTACARPLMLREARDAARAITTDVLVVRTWDRSAQASFDIQLAGDDQPLLAYRLWMPEPGGAAAWLVPTAGNTPYVRLDPMGLEVVDDAPYCSEADRNRGLHFGKDFLSVVVAGWI